METNFDAGESSTDGAAAAEAAGLLSHADTGKTEVSVARPWRARIAGWVKTIVLVGLLLLATVAFGLVEELPEQGRLIGITQGEVSSLPLHSKRYIVDVQLRLPVNGTGTVSLSVRQVDGTVVPGEVIELGDHWANEGHVYEVQRKIELNDEPEALLLSTTSPVPVATTVLVAYLSSLDKYSVLFAALILCLVYVLIIFEWIHRALAAMLGAFLSLGVLSVIGRQPPLDVILLWIDFETVMLLFGMMILVGVCAETGIFEWAAVKAYKLSGGNYWRLLGFLCLFAGVVSAFLDNVTTILLFTPVTIRMCNVIGLDPIPVLLAEVIFSNIGGTATAIGDPPNILIVSSDWSAVSPQGDIQFAEFTLHMMLAVIFVSIGCFGLVRYLYRHVTLNNPDPPELAELKREIKIWERTMSRIQATSEEEEYVRQSLDSKIRQLRALCEDSRFSATQTWQDKVKELEQHTQIRDRELLWDCIVVMSVVIVLFFIHSSVPSIHLNLGWIAMLGAISLLLLTGAKDLEGLLERIEWGTLLFFAALFILMEALAELGLIDFIGERTTEIIRNVPEKSRLSVGMILILWISAFASAFIDNIPFTTAMIPIIKTIAADKDVGLPVRPLVWALALGACLGGNGTLIGASANVVCAGLAEQAGYPISFLRFFKLGFPVMLVSVIIAMIYLLICHSAIGWNG